jgi:hypothetical protein
LIAKNPAAIGREMLEEISKKVPASASCSSFKGKGSTKLLFNHIAKTGGTAMKHVLRQLVPRDDVRIQEDIMTDAQLTSKDKQNFFVIGLVRRPCDYLVSWYYQLHDFKPTSTFEKFVTSQTNGVSNHSQKKPKLMSEALVDRYASGENVHCMIQTHKLEAGILDCMHKFKACGGAILGANEKGFSLKSTVKRALNEAVAIAHSRGRSVGNHPACTELFNKEMETRVLATEQSVIDKYGLESCCSNISLS